MHLMYFTEQPMSTYPSEIALQQDGVTALVFSNRYFDPVEGSRLYNERLGQYLLAEQVGFDGIMLNEHHDAPFCMQGQIHVWSSILAAMTQRVKIVLLGTPIPLSDNPVGIAEWLAMVDMISKGRLVSGFVRAGGTEHMANNANPAYNRERFVEAHDLIVKTWTTPGPFRWEGNHYQARVVNPWAVPLQTPHPRIWIPGVASPETVVWAAEHAYPYVCLNTTIRTSLKIWELYEETAQRMGYTSGPEHRGYLLRVHVQDTEEKALAGAREFMWMQGEFTGLAAGAWSSPAGYSSGNREQRMLELHGRLPKRSAPLPFEDQLAGGQIIAGTPDQVIERLRYLMERVRPGIFAFWGNDGKVNDADSRRCIELLGKEVLPAVREIARELDLPGPFEADTPASLATKDEKVRLKQRADYGVPA